MSEHSAIEWTDATWNPTRGCDEISSGCAHCYAKVFSERFRGVPGHPYEQGFDLRLVPEKLIEPTKWAKPRMIFVNSMSDLFHKDVPNEYILQVLGVMIATPWHVYQILTKRADRLPEFFEWWKTEATRGRYLDLQPAMALESVKHLSLHLKTANDWYLAHCDQSDRGRYDSPVPWPLPNVWLGVSIENQKTADERIPHLLRTPAAVRFLSVEPLLGPVDLHSSRCRQTGDCPTCPICLGGIHWVIVGGESGPGARPMHPDWVRRIRDDCVAAGVPFFFKQWGEHAPLGPTSGLDPDHYYPGRAKRISVPSGVPMDEPASMFRLGKKLSGRLLDGRTWDQMPVPAGER